MKTLSFLALGVLLAGCAGTNTGRVLSDSAAGAGGAVLGHQLSDGDPVWTAAGAAAGVLASEGIHHLGQKKARQSYQEGYDQGRSDAVKQQYWLMVEAQRETPEETSFSYYEIPVPEQRVDGALLLPTKRTLRIQE